MRGHAPMILLALLVTLGSTGLSAQQRQATPTPRRADIEVAVRSRSLQPGELVVLTITTSTPADIVSIRAFNRAIPPYRIDARTWRALIGIDLDVKPGSYSVAVDTVTASAPAPIRTTRTLAVIAKRFRTRTLTVDPDFVEPPPDAQARIVREAAELEQIWTESAAERLWSEPFVRPVREAANSVFGSRSVYNGVARSPHGGADFAGPAGTPVRAPNAGRVVLARDLYFTGKTVVLDHGLGLFSVLAHLSAIDVVEGGRTTAGEVIGRVGATGRVTGPHLHWGVRLGGARVDPLALLALVGPPPRSR